MVRFTVKTLLFLTALLATYTVTVSESVKGPSVAGFVAYCLFAALLFGNAARNVMRETSTRMNTHAEKAKRAAKKAHKRGDVEEQERIPSARSRTSSQSSDGSAISLERLQQILQ